MNDLGTERTAKNLETARETTRPRPRIKALLFDMDGLLIDTEAVYMRMWSELARRLGAEEPPERFADFVGIGSDHTAAWLATRCGNQASPEWILEKGEKLFVELIRAGKTPPLPGVKEIFAVCAELDLRRTVVTTTKREIALPVLEVLLKQLGRPAEPQKAFAAIVTGDLVEKRKPAPDLYLLAARKTGVKPEECAAFEDSVAGTTAARAAGCLTVAVPSPYMDAAEVSAPAHFTFRTLAEAAAARVWEQPKFSDNH